MDSPKIEITEFYNGYRPPRYFYGDVRRLVHSVPGKYLQGLQCIVLTNQAGQSRSRRRGRLWSRGRKARPDRVLGLYHRAGRGGKLPWIEIYVDKIAAEIRESRVRWIPIIRNVMIGLVLFHEIGHHIHANFRPEFREKEDVADGWGRKLTRDFLGKQYWYLRPVWRPMLLFLRAWRDSVP